MIQYLIMEKKCVVCNKVFQKPYYESQTRWKERRFCSVLCKNEHNRVRKKCAICKIDFIKHKSRKNQICCSRKCSNKHRSIFKEKYGGFKKGHKGYGAKPWLGKKFSKAHRDKISEANKNNPKVIKANKIKAKEFRKEKHWNWKGGITSESAKIRSSKKYNEWRFAVYKRDNYECRKCKEKCGSKTIVAHHIKDFNNFPELRFKISNGLTLCRKCHKKKHKKIGLNTRFTMEKR